MAAAGEASNLRGILAMTASCALFVSGDALVKSLVSTLPVGEILAIRGAVSVAITLPLLAWSGLVFRLHLLWSRAVAWRSLMDVGAAHFFFTALTVMALADASAIGQFTPLAVTAGAAMFLGEPVGWRRWLATLAGLVGVLLIIRPGTSAFNWWALLIVGSVLCVAARDLITRAMTLEIPSALIATATLATVAVSGLARLAFEVWTIPTLPELVALALAGIVNACGYYFAVLAIRSGEISAVGPFRYVSILLAVAIGYVAFGEVLDLASASGIGIVMAAGLYALHRERVRARVDAIHDRSTGS
jgi:drug/metabolite transporter (DMT)-like permease